MVFGKITGEVEMLTEEEIQKSIDEMLEGNPILKHLHSVSEKIPEHEAKIFEEILENRFDEHRQFFKQEMEKLRINIGMSQEEFDKITLGAEK